MLPMAISVARLCLLRLTLAVDSPLAPRTRRPLVLGEAARSDSGSHVCEEKTCAAHGALVQRPPPGELLTHLVRAESTDKGRSNCTLYMNVSFTSDVCLCYVVLCMFEKICIRSEAISAPDAQDGSGPS